METTELIYVIELAEQTDERQIIESGRAARAELAALKARISVQAGRMEKLEETIRNLQAKNNATHAKAEKLAEALKVLKGAFETNVRDCEKWVQYQSARAALAEWEQK